MYKIKTTIILLMSIVISTTLSAKDSEYTLKKVVGKTSNKIFKVTEIIPCKNFNNAMLANARKRVAPGKSVETYYRIAWKYVNNVGEKSYDAIANFEYAIKLSSNGAIYSDLGNCFRGGFKCFDQALLCYNNAIENGFRKSFVYYNRAICKYELGDKEGARIDFNISKSMGWNNDYYNLNQKTIN